MSKGEESKLNKIKSFLGIGNRPGSVQLSNIRPPNRDFFITPEIIKEISPTSPLSHRSKALKELCDLVVTKCLEENAVEILFSCTEDLLKAQIPVEERQLTLKFWQCLIKGQYKQLGVMRAHFFMVIKAHTLFEDLPYRLELFRTLTCDGKDLEYFEEETGLLLMEWMRDIISSTKTADFLWLLVNVIKFNAAYLDEEIVSGLVLNTCLIATRTGSEADIELCVKVLDTVVCYSYLPSSSLLHVVISLCRIVNIEKFCQQTRDLMYKLLGTHLGHSAIHTMCLILQDKANITDTGASLLRGAVFFVGMALWGPKRFGTLKHPPSAVLPSFIHAMKNSKSSVVFNEVTLSALRLVNKFGKEQQGFTWELILDITEIVLKHIELNPSVNPVLIGNVHELLTAIETLLEQGQFPGSHDRIFSLIETCSHKRPENSILVLVSHKAQSIHPSVKDNWILSLNYLVDRYFRQETRTQIRVKVLDILQETISKNRYLYEDDLIELVVLPQLAHLEHETDPEVKSRASKLVTDLAVSCQSACTLDLIDMLKKMISQPMMMSTPSSPTNTPVLAPHRQRHVDRYCHDMKTGVEALINIFKVKLYQSSCNHSLAAFEVLVSHVKDHYSHTQVLLQAGIVRKMVFEFFLSLRADHFQRLGLPDKKREWLYSPYAFCLEGQASGTDQETGSSTNIDVKCRVIIPYAEAFKCLRICLEEELDYDVLSLVLREMPFVLQNKSLVLSTCHSDVERFTDRICIMVSDKKLPEKFLNTTKLSKSDFHCELFPVLTTLVSYNTLMDKAKQRELIRCLEFGLVSKCARICVRALGVAILEMQDVMMGQLPLILIKLSQICATKPMAIPLMEFLSSLIHLPALYSNFVEKEYLSIFAIALNYTNPFKFSHYAVCMAHHVIALWFLKCRLSFRKTFANFLIKGLQANVIRQLEEATMVQRSHNQDSFDRNRTQSLNDEALRSRSQAAAQKARERALHNQTHQIDPNIATFHRELTETCIDMMARYTFSTCSSMPKRTPVSEFLLRDGQVQSWLLGNKLITITTSGGVKVGKSGLCEKCLTMARAASAKVEQSKLTIGQRPVLADANGGRRRHKSAAVRTMTETVAPLKPLSKDDITLHKQASVESGGSGDSTPMRERSDSHDYLLADSATPSEQYLQTRDSKMHAVDNVLMGLPAFGSDKSIFSSYLCNCWCTQWAEIHVRRPTGNLAWMVRIQNEQDLAEVFPDFSLSDISNLFLPDKPEMSLNSPNRIKIDSSDIGEQEYESLLEEHFHGNSGEAMFSLGMMGSLEDLNKDHSIIDPAVTEENQSPPVDTSMRKTKSSPELSPTHEPDSVDYTSIPQEDIQETQKLDQISEVSTHLKSPSTKETPRENPARERQPHVSGAGSIHSIPEETINSNTSPVVSEPASPPVQSTTTASSSPAAATAQPHISKGLLLPQTSPSAGSTSSSSSPAAGSRPVSGLISAMKSASTTPEKAMDSSKTVTSAASSKDLQGGVNPSFLFLQLYHNNLTIAPEERPIMLPPNNEVISRSVKMLDLIYPYETHKIGVIYVGRDQTAKETAILSNQYGSVRYMEFLSGLGQLLQLRDCNPESVYLGGLETKGSDGQFAYAWHDEFIQMIFHVATLMPNKESDPNCNAKKLHIGNDYVTIVYNDSSQEYRIGTIKGQFNYINLVIQPLDHGANAVTVQTRDDIAEVIGHTDTKIISDANLAVLVRQMALHANLASTILQKQKGRDSKDPYTSNWLERLRQIKRIHGKLLSETGAGRKHEHGQGNSAAQSSPTDIEDFTDFI